MNILKQIISYLIWVLLAFVLGVVHMRIILGELPTTGIFKTFKWLVLLAVMRIALIIGSIIAILFILVDVFYLKKKLENNIKSTGIRFVILIAIAGVVAITHYILEKVIDII